MDGLMHGKIPWLSRLRLGLFLLDNQDRDPGNMDCWWALLGGWTGKMRCPEQLNQPQTGSSRLQCDFAPSEFMKGLWLLTLGVEAQLVFG